MYQAFRGPSGRLEHLEAIYHTQSEQNVVFMDDIESLFPGFTALKKGLVTVAKARDASYKYIDPSCIKYQPDIVLEVVVGESGPAAVDSVVAQIAPSSGTCTHPNQDRDEPSFLDDNQLNINDIQSTLETLTLYSTSTTSVSSAIVTDSTLAEGAVSTEPSSISHRLLQRTQSMLQDSSTQLQVYEQTVQAGKLPQADAIMQGIEALQQELQGNFSRLHSEMTKNGVLQNQILDMQRAAETMAQRMLELQQRTVQMQQQALDRLALIQNKVSAIMTQTYELHEYPIPRLFIVLPKEDEDSTAEKLGRGFRNVFVKQFKLYFLCECGEHTKPPEIANNNSNNATKDSNSGDDSINLKHEVHVARHEGYDLDHPTEFFEKYGTYVLTLLQMLKYGVTIAGVVVAPMAQLSLGDGADAMQKGTDKLFSGMGHRVSNAIEYLQGLSEVPDQSSDRERDGERGISDRLGGLEALEGADLRQLGTFLRNKDDARVFGNLYRIVTSDGHVKWVCLDHYRQNYRSKTMKELKDVVESNDGQYDERTGRVSVKLASPITARQFYVTLAQSRFVNELEVALLWETSLQDLRDLKDAIQHSNVVQLKLTGGGGQGPFSDILNRTRRSDPIIQLMAAGKIRALSLYDNDGFLERISKVPTYLHIRMLDFGQSRLSTKELKRLAGLVPASPLLSLLVLKVFDLDEAVEIIQPAVEIIQPAVESNKHAAALTLRLTKDESHQAILQFNPHAGDILSIQLTAPWLQDTRLFLHPAVQSLLITPYRRIATSHGITRSKELVQTALSRYEALQSLELPCEPYHFHELLDFVRKTASSKCPSLQYLHLRHDDKNQLTSTKLQDPSATNVKLGVISTAGPSDSWDGVNSLFKHFGSEIQGLDLDMCLNYTQTERLLQSMKQAQGSKLRQVTWKIREPINPQIFPAMIQILDLSNPTPSSSTTTSDSTASPWKFTMILDMNRYPDIQPNTSSKASFLDNQMVRDAMANMLIHHVTHLSLHNTDLNQMVGHLQLMGCNGPFKQLRELTIDNQQLYDQGGRTVDQSQEPLERHAAEWIQSLVQRQEDTSSPSSISDERAIADNVSNPTLPRSRHHQMIVAVTSVSFKGVDLSPNAWNDLLQSLDFLTLRSLTIFLCNFTDKELSILIDCCLTTVNKAKAIGFLRTIDPQSNLTLVEERAVMDLWSQEGGGVGGQEGPMQVSVWKNQGVSKAHLFAEQKRILVNGVWWCKFNRA
ncbi:hypothetical protein BGZ96_000235 [Linnemannia gamsii]|uniref:Uncharacterized protein n=1 Tax=Linnemannia gamsii TaxID=64522 RepID=A0ABQ7KA70_9FUNG|nr:hypothetical protein BGZ96_000235 [Linnemannia gamsii]